MEFLYILFAIVVVIILFLIMYIMFTSSSGTPSGGGGGGGGGGTNASGNDSSSASGTNTGAKRSPAPELLKSGDKATTLMDIENENGVLYDSDRRTARSVAADAKQSKPQRQSRPAAIKSSFSFDSFVHYNGNDLYGMPEYSARFAQQYDLVSLNSLNELDIRPHGQLTTATDMDIAAIGQNRCPKMHEYRSVRDFMAMNRSKFTPSRSRAVDYYCSYPQTIDSAAYDNIVEPTSASVVYGKSYGNYLFEYDATMTVVPVETVLGDGKVVEFNYVHFTQRRKTLEFENLLQFIRAVNTLEQQYGDTPMILVGTFNVQAENYLQTLFDQSKYHVCSFNENPTHMVNGIDARVHDGLVVSKTLYPRVEYWTRYNDYVTTNDEALVLECRMFHESDVPGLYTYSNWRDKLLPLIEDPARPPNPELLTLKSQFREIMFKSKTPTVFPTPTTTAASATFARQHDDRRRRGLDETTAVVVVATAPPPPEDTRFTYGKNAVSMTTAGQQKYDDDHSQTQQQSAAAAEAAAAVLPPPTYDELGLKIGDRPVADGFLSSTKTDMKTGLKIIRDTSMKNINKLFTTLNNNGK